MNWNSFLHSGAFRASLCLILIAAILAGLFLPGIELNAAMPDAPRMEGQLQDITVLQVGQDTQEVKPVVVPSGGSAAPTEPRETDPQETNPQETRPGETVPNEEVSDTPDIGPGQEGNEDGNQGEEGGEEMALDLAMVMTWYQYGTHPKTIACSPSETVSKELNTAQLTDSRLRYAFGLNGTDAKYVTIHRVTVAPGDSPEETVDREGNVKIDLPGGGQRKYIFRVYARAEKKNDRGEKITQDITFTFVLRCSYHLDLELELLWRKKDGTERTVLCSPDGAEALAVQSYDLTDRVFSYGVTLKGPLADGAKITDARFTTASGQESGKLDAQNGILILNTAPGQEQDTYYLTFTVEVGGRTAVYSFYVTYFESLDVKLSFSWMEKGILRKTMTCRDGEMLKQQVKSGQLSAGAIPYSMELTGKDGMEGRIISVTYTSDNSGGALEPDGSLPMTLPEGKTENTYLITVHALVRGQRLTFQIRFHFTSDVMLQMHYTVQEDGKTVNRLLTCETGKSRTAEPVYDDQLTDGALSYTLSFAGADAETLSITAVTCYQSGSGRTLTLQRQDSVRLLLKEGKTGENRFSVQAMDRDGNVYEFDLNIPYKHRGENNICIHTNLVNGQQIMNETKINLSVKAWSQDENGNVVSYIPANGTDTKLIVTFDGQPIPYISSSGAASEYDLFPENPELGDTNTHILTIYAEDAFGNYGELTLDLIGQRREPGQKAGTATIYVDMTVLGLGVVDSLQYQILADEPISYVIAKALFGQTLPEPFGAAEDTFGWTGRYAGTLDIGFYLQSINTGYTPNALEGSMWPGSTEQEVLDAIDARFGKGSNLAILWRCIYRNGLNKSSGSGNSVGEFDYTSGSGWMYSVGETTYYPGQSMSAIYLRDGDVLTLRFTLAYGWDVGGGTAGYGSTVGYCISGVNGIFRVNHRMETHTDANGIQTHICRCCGMIEECLHENVTAKDQGDGTHIRYCDDCSKQLGDPEDHIWVSEAEDSRHTCTECDAAEDHDLVEIPGSNTATCTEPGKRSVECAGCHMVRQEDTGPRGHTLDNKWQYRADVHYQKCSTCGVDMNRNAHQYVYDEGWEDYVCLICQVLHDWDIGCGGNLTVAEQTCTEIVYICDGCGCRLKKPGMYEAYHVFTDGVCSHCGKPEE